MNRYGMATAIGAILMAAGCNQTPNAGVAGSPDTVTINGVTYTKSGAAPAAPAANPFGGPPATSPAAPAAPAAGMPVAPTAGTIPAIGHWSAMNQGDDKCRELSDVMFTATSIVQVKPDGQPGESHPVTYGNVTPSSFTIYEVPGGRALANVTMNSPGSLTMNRPDGSFRPCTLIRR